MERLWDTLPSIELYFKYWNSELNFCGSCPAPSMLTTVVREVRDGSRQKFSLSTDASSFGFHILQILRCISV